MVSLGKYSQALPMLGGRITSPSFPLRTSRLAFPHSQCVTMFPSSLTFKPNSQLPSTPFCTLTSNAPASANVASIATKAEESVIEYPISLDEEYIKRAGLRPDRMPRHLGLTLDGNRRWCDKNNDGKLSYVPFYRGYVEFGDLCIKLGIPAASWFIFANCTWKRTDEANNLMFRQLQESLEENLVKFIRQGVRVSIIGDKWKLPKSYQEAYSKVEEATKKGTTLHMMYAIPYGGREDMLEAAGRITDKVMAGEIEPEDIDEDMVERELCTGICQVPVSDLMIRTGAKNRISNFFLWQASYAELYFSDALSADFEEAEFLHALRWFQNSEKRFGK